MRTPDAVLVVVLGPRLLGREVAPAARPRCRSRSAEATRAMRGGEAVCMSGAE